jgi:hypothetical protein
MNEKSNRTESLTQSIEEAAKNPKNLGEMESADAVGTVGRSDCGDMLRMWVKFREENGRRVIDRATFQTFGCQTAIAVASVATEMIRGKTSEEALALKGDQLSSPLGALPPMKIHCAQLVEDALKSALNPSAARPQNGSLKSGPTLADQITPEGKVKITLLPKKDTV